MEAGPESTSVEHRDPGPWLQRARAPAVQAVGLFLLIAACTSAIATWIHNDRLRQLEATTALIARQAASQLEAWFDARFAAIDFLTARQSDHWGSNPDAFRDDAALLLERLPGLLALNWVDADGVIRIITPEAGNEAALNSNLFEHPEPDVARALAEAAVSGVTRTRTITLLQTGPGFAVYWPVMRPNGAVGGFVNGVFRAEELIESSGLAARLGAGYRLELRDLDGAVAWSSSRNAARSWPLSSEQRLPTLGVDLALRVAPSPSTITGAVSSPQLMVALSISYLLAALVAILLWWRMLAGDELRRRAGRMRDLLDQLPHAVYMKDADGRLTFMNRKLADVWGEPSSALIGTPSVALPLAQGARATAVGADREVLDSGEGMSVREETVTDADGNERIFEVARVPFRQPREGGAAMLGAGVDVTARHEAEAFRERVAIALDQAGEAITVLDRRGRIIFANPAFVTMMGFEGRDVLGLSINAFVAEGSDDTQLLADIAEVLGRGEIWKSRYVSTWRDGIGRVRDATIAPVRADGRTTGYIGVLRDVTREAGLEEQLRQSQKLEAVGRLAGGVAHDFNNLLTVILGYTEVLRHDVALHQGASEVVIEIERAAERAASLTRQLLTFSRRRSTRAVSADLNAVVHGLMPMLERLIGEDIGLELELEEDVGRVGADTEEIEQIIVNLCVNARDALREGGRITLATATREASGASGLRPSLAAGRHAVLSVADDGCGMLADVQEHAFEPFFTTKGEGLGTGLGLSMVYGIAEQRRGAVQVESQPGVGTKMSVWLPSAAPSAATETPPSAKDSVALAPKAGASVLLVEDEAGIRALMTRTLERAGYQVVSAADGVEALERAPSLATIDLLLTDVVMPRMGGPELRERLAELRPGLRVLFISGYAPDAPHVGRLTADDVLLEKPFRPRELLEAVAAQIAGPKRPPVPGARE